MRRAVVSGGVPTTIARYLPSNYKVAGETLDGKTIIEGEDVAGWTLGGYVFPRLMSGLYAVKEIPVAASK